MKKHLLFLKDDASMDLLITLPRFHNELMTKEELQIDAPGYHKDKDGTVTYFINSKKSSKKEIIELNKYRSAVIKKYLEKQAERYQLISYKLHEYLKENFITSSFDETKNPKYAQSSFLVTISKKNLKNLLNEHIDDISSIGLHAEAIYSISEAMLATEVNPVALNGSNSRGNGIGIYFADAGCPLDANLFNNYFSDHRCYGLGVAPGCSSPQNGNNHTFLITGVIDSVASESKKYCHSSVVLNSTTLPSATMMNQNPAIKVESYSINKNVTDRFYTVEDKLWDEHVLDSGSLVFVAAGNDVVNVRAPGKAYNVITVGNYNDATDTIANNSNYINATTDNEKPELVAPGTNISYSRNGHIVSDTGTSFAAPHAAAIAADMMSANPTYDGNAVATKAMMLAGATDTINDVLGSSGDSAVGAGGINARSVLIYDRYVNTYTDSNNPFTWGSSAVCKTEYFNAYFWETVQVSMTWMVDADYISSNNELANIYYFYVIDPSGNPIALSWQGSSSYPNSNNWMTDNWSVAKFDADYSGQHVLMVCRYNSYSDQNANESLNLAVAVTAQ